MRLFNVTWQNQLLRVQTKVFSFELNRIQTLRILYAFGAFVVLSFFFFFTRGGVAEDLLMLEDVKLRSFNVDIRTVGELEASLSTIISSSIRGDLGKVIYLIRDGENVKEGELLVKMDPSPFEEKIEELKAKIKEKEASLDSYKQLYESEINQVEHEVKIATAEVEFAELELNKVVNGDGPLEISRIKASMQKAFIKYDELQNYSNDLIDLQERGYLNLIELKQAQKKLQEEKDAYETAKIQYESYVEHVFPMQVKKAEAQVKKAKLNLEEKNKSGSYRIAKASASLKQAQEELNNLMLQLRGAEYDLYISEIKAPAPGMAVLREEFRTGQKRKPRVGDILIKNQPLLDLPDLSSMIVKTKVREIDLFKIAIGKPVTIEVDAYPNLHMTGKVQWIGVLALTDYGRNSEEKYFDVKVELDSVDSKLRPGMTSRATIHASAVHQKPSIPLHAVFDIQKKTYCYVYKKNHCELTPIEVGMSNEQWVEVVSGLKAGEKVCLIVPENIPIIRKT